MNDSVAAAKRRVALWCAVLFTGGGIMGGLLAHLYLGHSQSPDRIFHAGVIWASASLTFPMFALSLRLLLWAYYQSIDSGVTLGQKLDKIIKPTATQIPAGPVQVPVDADVDLGNQL